MKKQWRETLRAQFEIDFLEKHPEFERDREVEKLLPSEMSVYRRRCGERKAVFISSTLYGGFDLRSAIDALPDPEAPDFDPRARGIFFTVSDICLHCEESRWFVFAKNASLLATLRRHNRFCHLREHEMESFLWGEI